MTARLKVHRADDREALAGLYVGGWNPSAQTVGAVSEIISDVRVRGDRALEELTRRFDATGGAAWSLRVPIPIVEDARRALPTQIAAGLELARERITAFHRRQIAPEISYEEADGTKYALLTRPVVAVGAYVPGGTAVLPSSVLMTCIPARIAGVERLVVVTPPRADGSIAPAILFACALCDVDELYAIGGSQAIAALAYGTESIERVDVIVGPGSVWVTEAKRQVFGTCGIDSLAGPSEVLVVADASSRPEYVAGELLAQAEHDPLARVAAVATDRGVLEAVATLLAGAFARETGRSEIIGRVLAERAFLIEAANEDEILDVIERFAPEHLSIQTSEPMRLVPRIRRAGAIFIGPMTPVAAGDYIAGTNHVLPTSGAGRFSSGLRVADFERTISLVANSTERMQADAPALEALALFEGLPAHARTARMRA